jgi:hypothetical protein
MTAREIGPIDRRARLLDGVYPGGVAQQALD